MTDKEGKKKKRETVRCRIRSFVQSVVCSSVHEWKEGEERREKMEKSILDCSTRKRMGKAKLPSTQLKQKKKFE